MCFKKGLGFLFDRFEFIKMGKQGKRVLKENINLTLEMDCLKEKLLKLETEKFAMIRERS